MFSCACKASTAVCMRNMDEASISSFDASSSSSSTAVLLGGRTIDRHNPIIRDQKRTQQLTLPSIAPCVSQIPPINPKPVSYQQLEKKGSSKGGRPGSETRKQARKHSNDHRAKKPSSVAVADDDTCKDNVSSHLAKHVMSKRWDVGSVLGADFISPPSSSRYLLGEPSSSFERRPGMFLSNNSDLGSRRGSKALVNVSDYALHDQQDVSSSSLPEKPFNQAVVLRVSLHCKGCEGKVRKHLSRMEGVSSFAIDFAAKKVTIEGNISPLSVLASVSKVKSAQFWTATAPATDQN